MNSKEINPKEVHIWTASLLKNKNNVSHFYHILSADERERANKFKFFKDQEQFIITRGILRQLLSNYLKRPPQSLEIMYGLWGKPCLPQEESLLFNLSHSGDYALYAVTRNQEVGIDLEYIDNTLPLEEMGLYIFSETELTAWKFLEPEEKVNSFFTRWVSMEAYLKALGKGWLEDKSANTFAAMKKFSPKNLNQLANLYSFECIPGYASALFVEGTLLNPRHYFWN